MLTKRKLFQIFLDTHKNVSILDRKEFQAAVLSCLESCLSPDQAIKKDLEAFNIVYCDKIAKLYKQFGRKSDKVLSSSRNSEFFNTVIQFQPPSQPNM